MTEIADFVREEKGILSITPLQREMSGRVIGKYNMQNIARDFQEGEWLWQQCRETERKNGYKLCDTCHERFKCWTAGRPQVAIIEDTHIGFGLQKIQQAMKMNMLTIDEASHIMCDVIKKTCLTS